ncbi:hypothetical protein SBA2_10061 [Acidobacteriia bacterium SbA2]|nr:hypothetical protein SBA2_10061 [Acidobacteriia bacterium SbA2]
MPAVILSEAKDLRSLLGIDEKQTAEILRFAQDDTTATDY